MDLRSFRIHISDLGPGLDLNFRPNILALREAKILVLDLVMLGHFVGIRTLGLVREMSIRVQTSHFDLSLDFGFWS